MRLQRSKSLAALILACACLADAETLHAQSHAPCGPTGFTGWFGSYFCVGRHCRGGVPQGTECTCPPQGPHFGYFPTCWNTFPGSWANCPVQPWSCAAPSHGPAAFPLAPEAFPAGEIFAPPGAYAPIPEVVVPRPTPLPTPLPAPTHNHRDDPPQPPQPLLPILDQEEP